MFGYPYAVFRRDSVVSLVVVVAGDFGVLLDPVCCATRFILQMNPHIPNDLAPLTHIFYCLCVWGWGVILLSLPNRARYEHIGIIYYIHNMGVLSDCAKWAKWGGPLSL